MVETDYLKHLGFVGHSTSPYNLYVDYTKRGIKITHWIVDDKFTIDGKKMMGVGFKELIGLDKRLGSYESFKLWKRSKAIKKVLDND